MLYPHAPIHPERSFSNENESKTKDVVPVEDASKIDLLRKTSSSLDSKPPISSASVIGSNGDKGKQVVGAIEQKFNFPISSIHPSLRHKSANELRHSLGSTLRGFDSSVLKSLAKVDSSSVGPNSSLLKNLTLNRNMNSPTCKTVAGVLARQSSNPSCFLPIKKRLSSMFYLRAPIHPECSFSNENGCKTNAPIHPNTSSSPSRNVGDPVKQSLSGQEAIGTTKFLSRRKLLPNKGSKLLELVSRNLIFPSHQYILPYDTSLGMCSELVVETLVQANAGTAVRPAGTFEANVVKTEVVRQNLQSIELSTKELLDQKPMKCEPMPLAPQQGCTSDLSVSGGDLSTPSEYSDIATKNANFDLKELNVSSDKVEASVSTRIYDYGPKFVRDRFQDRSFGSSRGNFMRGRRRGWGRFHRLRRDWYSGCDIESYGGIADYRFRNNCTAAVWESANERNDYDSRLDGGAFASNRRRNPLNDALHSFRNPPAR
ncbi:hypothetical protein RDI58_010045 [Solanum bulbocastanum]|uniref:Uncharacterized protein n=1 Tax=Solanum bulbocastanum TaxID=147425 RepID=A0AAN8TNK9_SOLBU